jgi:DNA-binding MarR family transcriptional regulator
MLIFRLARVTGYRLSRALATLEMRTNEFAVLHHLKLAGPLSQQELGTALRINPSNLVGLLDALEDDGLIVRPRDPADRRRHVVGLTAAGQSRLAEAKRAVARAEQDLLAPLDPTERAQLQALLERLARHTCGPGQPC